MDCGRPHAHAGVVADIVRCTRAAYHYTIRWVRTNENDVVNERFARVILENCARDFWSEMQALNVTLEVRCVL